LALLALALVGFAPNAMAAKAGRPNSQAQRGVLDHELTRRSTRNTGTTRVIITLKPGATMPGELKKFVTVSHRRLGIINGQVVTIPNALLQKFASHPSVLQIDYDRPIGKLNFRTAVTIGSPAVHHGYGLTGAGVTVATIDSGIATWHDDLTNRTGTLYPYGNQRVSAFVDFVDGNPVPHDDQGHGTHVAGIIAGNGYDSLGQKAGVAPDANLVSLKVLDGNGNGTISNIIAAFDWIVANRQQYNIRVVNASVGAAIRESYFTDPLTLAAKHVVDAGVVVVVAAGNLGKNAAGLPQYGGITAPGNAPWVVTVGASSTMGTPDRADDTMASFSSRGPTFKDWGAKPDLVAPGAGTVSLAAPLSTFYTTKAQYLIPGSVSTPLVPYLTLSGTSMAAPVVTGTVALMLQANPSLTPNMVKAILEYTAQPYPGYDSLTQGAGFLNTLGAVQLAQFYATAHPGDPIPAQSMWSKRIIWGNHALAGGKLLPSANAFKVGTNWGAFKLDDLSNVVWGTAEDADVVWGTDDDGNVVWGTDAGDDSNVVWGTDCGGDDCDNVVWGTADDDNVVWGTSDDGDIVWGTSDDESVVWGTADDDNVVWGTDDDGNVVWGTDDGGNVVWGTVTGGQVTWYGANGTVRPIDWVSVVQSMTDEQVFLLLKTITTTLAPTVTTSGGTGSF
jgi:subtilisin family serine protease